MAPSETFYADLPSFTDFGGFAEFEAYAPVPADWVVLCGDIRGSTRAIAEGRYKEVNMVGAAVITAVLNASPGLKLPFVFGGDGGMAAVPGSAAEAGAAALRRLQGYATRAFGLELRAAAIPVVRLREDGHDLRLRKFELSPGNMLAMFAGGGAEHADRILKTAPPQDPAILVPDPAEAEPDLDGLSCRWEPLTAARGQMIALMVQPRAGATPEAYRTILAGVARVLDGALDGELSRFAPVSERTLRFRWPPKGLRLETRAGRPGRSRLRRYAWGLFSSAVQGWCEWRKVRLGPYDGATYRAEMIAQTDFRKFDGMLRTVLDVAPDQADRLEAWLDGEYRAGRLVYGLHRDRTALMTCLVFDLDQSQHVHFVDAAGGGFAKAAAAFKARLEGR